MKGSTFLEQSLKLDPELTFSAIDFFTCSAYRDRGWYPEILKFFEKIYSKKEDSARLVWIQMGKFTKIDFEVFARHNLIEGTGYSQLAADTVLKELVEKSVVYDIYYEDKTFRPFEDKIYNPIYDYTKFLRENDLLDNLVFGVNHIIKKYNSSVALIEVISSVGTISVGTGFLIQFNNSQWIVTNQHVVHGSEIVKLYLDNNIIDYETIVESSEYDIAFIKIKDFLFYPVFYLNIEMDIMGEIITIGYPTIPMTKDAYKVYHRGEINSFVQNYEGNELFLISAKTSSGNSGSPVIDKHGSVVGIITSELFEEEAFKKRGKLPYYAAIPSSIIISELNKLA